MSNSGGREAKQFYFESDCWALLLVAHIWRHGLDFESRCENLHVCLLCLGGLVRLSKLVCIHENEGSFKMRAHFRDDIMFSTACHVICL
jgi:hypothetical protein